MTEKDFINILLEKSKETKEGIFIPKKVILKISQLEKFDIKIADNLSKKPVEVFSKQFGSKNKEDQKESYTTNLIQYSVENDYIIFYPSILKNYLNEN